MICHMIYHKKKSMQKNLTAGYIHAYTYVQNFKAFKEDRTYKVNDLFLQIAIAKNQLLIFKI